MANKSFLDYDGLRHTLSKLLPGSRKIWYGTLDEWEALSAAEKDKYNQAEIIINAVNKIELNNKNPIQNKAVFNKHNEIGWVYGTNQVQHAGANFSWINDIRVTFTNLPEGNYLVFGNISYSNVGSETNHLGIISVNTNNVTSGVTIIPVGITGFQIPTSDWYGQSALIGVMQNTKSQNVSFGVNLYRAAGNAPLYANVAAIKIG